jgi:hypothetical protein
MDQVLDAINQAWKDRSVADHSAACNRLKGLVSQVLSA